MLMAWICSMAMAQLKTITVDGTARSYLEYVPANLGAKRPLLISCHGMSQDAAYQKGMLQVEGIADTAKFVTVFPNGINNAWDISGDRDINLIKALIVRMAQQYDIDTDRVYLSGFSMGGMMTYHAMTKIADKIAAFAPISGYPIYGMQYTSSRPIPIIHTHGTADDVCTFDKVQGILDGWIKRNKCSTTPKVTTTYKGHGHVTRREWTGGANRVKVVLVELANKGHWVSNDGYVTADGIWNFCKNYTLAQKGPKITFLSPKANETTGRDVKIEVEATDTEGTVTEVSFYVDNMLRGKVTETPYTMTVNGLKDGTHTISVVAADDKGNRAMEKIAINTDATDVRQVQAVKGRSTREYSIDGRPASRTGKGEIVISNGKKGIRR